MIAKKIIFIFTSLFLVMFTFIQVKADDFLIYQAVVKVPVAGVHEKPNAKSPLHTQTLYNEKVEVLQVSNGFAYAKVQDGYKGWIKITDITKNLISLSSEGNKVIVNAKSTIISNEAGIELVTVPMSTTLFGTLEKEKYRVTLPENIIGYINKEDAFMLLRDEEIKITNGALFVETAKKFTGTNYLWGGCSTLGGIDCSGLTYISAKMNGITLPRDSGPQSLTGTAVKLSEAKIGDQMFFGSSSKKLKVSHTGIYIGEGYFIHSSGGSKVKINHISDNSYLKILMSIRRQFEN